MWLGVLMRGFLRRGFRFGERVGEGFLDKLFL